MAVGGDGVARIPFQDKSLVIFVGKTAPKDQVRIKIVSVEKNFLNGVILEILKPGPHRREPPCSFALRCGGCSWQQITEDEQVRQKEMLLQELFKKFLPDVPYTLKTTVRSPQELHYRNRIQLKRQNELLGYFEDKTHQLVDINACLIADKRISDEIPNLKRTLKKDAEVTKYEIKISQDNELSHNRIGEKGQGLSFAQVNTEMNCLLKTEVAELALSASPRTVSELYAGAGNFTFDLARSLPATTIEAVELNPELTTAAIKKVTALNLQKRLSFFTSDCDTFVARRSLSSDFILLDPPRAGCSDVVLQKVSGSDAKNILYISCHPVSLVRDLQKLNLAKNGYTIQSLQVFDMFPQTDHFETVVMLAKS